MRGLSFSALAVEIMSKFVGSDEIPIETLKQIVYSSYSNFRTIEVTPMVKVQDYWVLELFHGPTFAFKDVALQLLGNIFEYFLQRGKFMHSLTILGATSGDTGSAAIHGLRGKKNLNCYIMFPLNKVTEIQERQMTTIVDENAHCLAIEGDFDDAQALVKAAFADETFRNDVNLGAINSINWARVLAQITYYFYAWLRATDELSATINANKTSVNEPTPQLPRAVFAVPTGNFGDILAGYYARQMGLPVEKLIICTSDNDVLHRFLQTGEYRKCPAKITLAPSMDISVSSNFERYLYYLADESPSVLKSWMHTFETTAVLRVSGDVLRRAQKDFNSHATSEEEMLAIMNAMYRNEKYLVCPHTATAVVGLQAYVAAHAVSSVPSSEQSVRPVHVCLATAHPAKFDHAVQLALGEDVVPPPRPMELNALFELPTRRVQIPNSLEVVKSYIRNSLKK